MILVATLLLVLAADTVTFLLLPPGAELNPLVLTLGSAAAITLRWLAALALIYLAPRVRPGLREAGLLTAIVVSAVGAGSNLSVLL